MLIKYLRDKVEKLDTGHCLSHAEAASLKKTCRFFSVQAGDGSRCDTGADLPGVSQGTEKRP